MRFLPRIAILLALTLSTALPAPPVAGPPPEVPSSNLSLGVNYVFPVLDYQYLLFHHYAVGITTMFFYYPASPGQLLSGGGAFITLNYYADGPFEGPWFQLGGGVQSLRFSQGPLQESHLPPAILFQLGWRWQLTTGANFGFAVGAQYLMNLKPRQFVTDFSGLLPAFTLQVGFPL